MQEEKQIQRISSRVNQSEVRNRQSGLADNRMTAISQAKLLKDISHSNPSSAKSSETSQFQCSTIQCVLFPHKLSGLPDYHLAIDYDWGQWEQGYIDNVQMIPVSPLPGNSPMMAEWGDGNYSVYYDPNICSQMPPPAVYFILLHELTHIDAPEQDDPLKTPKEKEMQADDSASLNLIYRLPNIAADCINEITAYFEMNDAPEGDVHPADFRRYNRAIAFLNEAERLLGTVIINDDPTITERQASHALKYMGYDKEERKEKLEEALKDGQMRMFSPSGTVMTFYEIADLLKKLDRFEQQEGIQFTLNIEWMQSAESIFSAVEAPIDDTDIAELVNLIAGLRI